MFRAVELFEVKLFYAHVEIYISVLIYIYVQQIKIFCKYFYYNLKMKLCVKLNSRKITEYERRKKSERFLIY